MGQQPQPAVRVDDTLSHQRWNDPQFPYNPLDRGTALQYFEFSPFFDPNSNNHEARRQGLDPANETHLRTMPMDTTEFALAETHEPHLFVVRKQQRQAAAAGRASISNYFYILGHERHTYQAPNIHAAVTARLQRSMHHVREGFKRFKADLAPLPKVLKEAQQNEQEQQEQQQQREQQLLGDPLDFVTGAAAAGPAAAASSAAAKATAAAATRPVAVAEVLTEEAHEHWRQTDRTIMDVLRRYPAPRLPKSKAQEAEEARRREELLQRQQQKQQQAAQQPTPAQQQQQQQQQAAPAMAEPLAAGAADAAGIGALDPAAAAAMPVPLTALPAGTAAAAAAAPQTGSKGLTRLRKMGSAKQLAAAAAEPAMAAAAAEAAAGVKQAGVKRSRSAAADQQQQQYQQLQYDPQQYQQQQYDPQQQQYYQQYQEGYGMPVPTADTLSQGSAGRSQGTFSQGAYSTAYSSAAAAAAGVGSGGGAPSSSMHGGPTTSTGTGGTAATGAGGGRTLRIKLKKGIKLKQQQPPAPQQ